MIKTLEQWIEDWSKNKRSFKIKPKYGVTVVKFDSSGMNFNDEMRGLNLIIDYELIQEPVDFMTAAKAYYKGKTIQCEAEGVKFIYKPGISKFDIWKNIKCDDIAISAKEILEGKWFIEE